MLSLAAVGLAMVLDWMHAQFNSGAYYWNESLLFNTYWLLFLPIGMLFQTRAIPFIKKTALAIAIHALVYALLVQTLSMLLFEHTYNFLTTLQYTSFNDCYKYLLMYSLLFYLPKSNNSRPVPAPALNDSAPDGLTIKEGRQVLFLPYASITHIRAERPYIAIHTAEKQFLQLESLTSIAEQLPPDQFFRIHKSVIVQAAAILSLRSRGNGDYDVALLDGTELRMSRRYVQHLKTRVNLEKLLR